MLSTDPDRQRRILGERIHNARRRLRPKPSQESVAKTIGRGKNWMSELENGERSATIDEILHLAEVLGCDPNYLIGMADEPGTIGSADPGLLHRLSYPIPAPLAA